jgi:FdrA protein
VLSTLVVVRKQAYVDSVTLLQVTAEVLDLDGVADAALVMATDLNREVLRESGLLFSDAESAGPNDLVIAVRARDDSTTKAALQHAESLLVRRGSTVVADQSTGVQPHSLRSAHRGDPEAQLAVISVPGQFAAAEARMALADGLHVFLFSDNVSLHDEVDLKRLARQRDLLVMGPDCGTGILNGVGLGFANVVRQGSIGVVGASGTGIQEITTLVHQAGLGISHAIGTGSRDLYAEVGGVTTLQALSLLAGDPATATIVLVSKPSDPDVARGVLRALAATGKPCVAYLQGSSAALPAGVQGAASLAAAARLATGSKVEPSTEMPAGNPPSRQRQHRVVGLFCGGTLAQEAAAVLGEQTPHEVIDFGDDQYTRGRAHPMIDPTLRNQAIMQAGSDPRVGVILLDFILGLGAHADPAGAASPAIRSAVGAATDAGRDLAIIAHIVGTELDPQGMSRQAATLRSVGVQVFESNYAAAQAASTYVGGFAP